MTPAKDSTPIAIVLPPANIIWWLCTHIGSFHPHLRAESLQAPNGTVRKGRPEYVLCMLARTISSNLQYQEAARIGAMCAGHMAACGKCIERAMQMFCSISLAGISRVVVGALMRYLFRKG